MADAPSDKLRVDKWLWHARFFKSRSLAGEAVANLRVNGQPVDKPSHAVRPGDVLTFMAGRRVRVIRIEAIGTRRGPAPEAQALYTDLDPPTPKTEGETGVAPAQPAAREPGSGRPTKRARRDIDALHRRGP
ncbi:MAG: RNA-binding S4 domain-containing protein [Pseudomonadota bacterium]